LTTLIRRDEGEEKERKKEISSFSQLCLDDEPMKDFLLLFFSLSFQPLEIKLIDDDGW
jgi:hypothetical protein